MASSKTRGPAYPVPLFPSYSPDNVRTIKMEVTKEIAEALLGRNENNRRVQDYRVDDYAELIKRGEWMLNGESIKIAFDGKLLDGQKRLKAVVQSGLSIVTMVAYGLSYESQDTIDSGQKRTQADVLHMKGYTDTARLAAVVNIVHRYHAGTLVTDHRIVRPTTQQVLDYTKHNEALLYNALTHGNMLTARIPVVVTAAAASWYLIAEVNAIDLDEFWTRLITGEHQIATDPVWVLRERISYGIKRPGGVKGKIPSVLTVALILKAFRYHVTNRAIKQIRFDLEREPFPIVAPPLGEISGGYDSDEPEEMETEETPYDEFDVDGD